MRTLFLIALALLICGTCTPRQAQAQQTNLPGIGVGLPGEPWTLVFDVPGYKVKENGLQPDGRAYLLAENQSTGVTLSVYLERISGQATTDMEILEYTIPDFEGNPVQQRNLFACIAKDDVYVDVHLSKALFKADQEQLLNSVLTSAHFAGNSSSNVSAAQPAPSGATSDTSLDYFLEGGRYFLKQDFAASIGPYQKALDAERQSRELSKDYWRVLVDNLGIAYGITGNLDRAEQTFNYGLSQDSTYPMFYYNLACVAAGRNDIDKTMELLRKAFAYRANTIPSESMPDPRKDDSFKPFMADKRFQEFLNTL